MEREREREGLNRSGRLHRHCKNPSYAHYPLVAEQLANSAIVNDLQRLTAAETSLV